MLFILEVWLYNLEAGSSGLGRCCERVVKKIPLIDILHTVFFAEVSVQWYFFSQTTD